MMYELLHADRPFRGKDKRTLIKKGEYLFPPTILLSEACKSCVSSFLQVDVSNRLWNGPENWTLLTKHAFFLDIDWKLAPLKKLNPLFVPCATKSNFETFGDVNVKGNVEKRKVPASELAADLAMIDKAFKVSLR